MTAQEAAYMDAVFAGTGARMIHYVDHCLSSPSRIAKPHSLFECDSLALLTGRKHHVLNEIQSRIQKHKIQGSVQSLDD